MSWSPETTRRPARPKGGGGGGGKESSQSDPVMEKFRKMLQGMEDRMLERLDQFEQVSQICDNMARDYQKNVQTMDARIQAVEEGPPGTSGISPSSEMNAHEFIAAIDNVIHSHSGNAEPSQENGITEGQQSRHARRRQQWQYEESASQNMGDQRQDAWVSQQFHRYPRYWGQTGNPSTTYPGPRFENNRGGYSRPGQNLLDREDRADHSDIHSRILNTAQSHGRDTAGWRRKGRQWSSSVDPDSEEEEYRWDQKQSGRSYSGSRGKFGSGS